LRPVSPTWATTTMRVTSLSLHPVSRT
jgi:hypothetical protein